MARNPKIIRVLLLFFAPLRVLHRIRFEGLERIPERPCLIVGNHSIGAVLEIFGILYAWEKRFGFLYDRPAFGLAHRLAFRVPGIATLMRGVGAVPADFDSAKLALSKGSVLVFPGGNWEATRHFRRGNEVDFDGHRGWIQVAKNSGVDILPVAISGAYRVNPVLGRSRWLAKISLFESFLSVRWLPVTVGQFVFAGLFFAVVATKLPLAFALIGTFYVFCFTPLFPIWPARITIRFGEPMKSTAPNDELFRDVQSILRTYVD